MVSETFMPIRVFKDARVSFASCSLGIPFPCSNCRRKLAKFLCTASLYFACLVFTVPLGEGCCQQEKLKQLGPPGGQTLLFITKTGVAFGSLYIPLGFVQFLTIVDVQLFSQRLLRFYVVVDRLCSVLQYLIPNYK